MCDFSNKTGGKEPGYFYPNSLLSILSEATQSLLDWPCLLVKIQGVLRLLPRYAWHVGGLPCEDVPVGAEEGGEHKFLCGVEVSPDQGGLVGVVVTEDDRLRLAVTVQLGPRLIGGFLELIHREGLCRLGDRGLVVASLHGFCSVDVLRLAGVRHLDVVADGEDSVRSEHL